MGQMELSTSGHIANTLRDKTPRSIKQSHVRFASTPKSILGHIIGWSALIAVVVGIAVGYFKLPAPYHHKIGDKFIGIVSEVRQDGTMSILPSQNIRRGFTCSIYGIVLPISDLKLKHDLYNGLNKMMLRQGVVVNVIDKAAQQNERYRLIRERDNLDVAHEIVRQGLAFTDIPEYADAEIEAQKAKRGVWSKPGVYEPGQYIVN